MHERHAVWISSINYYPDLDVLEKWEVPPINEVNRKLENLERSIRKHEELLDNFRYTWRYYNYVAQYKYE